MTRFRENCPWFFRYDIFDLDGYIDEMHSIGRDREVFQKEWCFLVLTIKNVGNFFVGVSVSVPD
jgi:hypothetical protein